MRLDEADIDLHGWLRAFYSCKALGRSFVMDHGAQRPLPSYADFSYGRKDYHLVLKEVLQPLGLRLVQGRWMDAVVAAKEPAPPSPPAPLGGATAGRGGAAPDSAAPGSLLPALDSLIVPSPRRLRAKASGLLKSSARRMGFEWGELLASASASSSNSTRQRGARSHASAAALFDVSLRASDSLGSMDFARIVDFSAFDSARVVFGSEIRRAESTVNYENGSALTQYSSLFDGLTVALAGERWAFVWRGSGSVLEVPGSLGSCASGSNKISFSSTVGVPFLSRIPAIGKLFSYEGRYDDELLITVCMEDVTDA
jgi:hypothetical protein